MSAIGFVPSSEYAEAVVSWTRALSGGESPVEFLCRGRWQESATREAVRAVLGGVEAKVTAVDDADVVAGVVRHCREVKAQLLVTTVFRITDWPDQDSNRLIDAAPCRTIVGHFGDKGGLDARKVLVIASGGPHDQALLDLIRQPGLQVTVAGVEEDIGEESKTLGRRALEQILRDANIEAADHVETRVVVDNDLFRGVLRVADDSDLVLMGFDHKDLALPLHQALGGTATAVVKRIPPLRRRALSEWIPRINPADYVELVQNLRVGSRWGANFVVMLAMAAAIASLGLLQDSPAVVIGSMLLAPLMTPMIGVGLSVVQANPRLAALAARSIGLGILVTLAVSFVMGIVVPGGELLSTETLARGTPNILDLMIALFAAVAAAYALARPGIYGAIAGVAIATALVPPLCSVGISLAYSEWLNASGAAALFITNLVAIALASSLTFFLMGVTSARALARHRRLARLVAMVLVAMLLAFSIPLGNSLAERITAGSVRPLGYPVKRTVARVIQERVEQDNGVELMFMARSSTSGGVVIYVASAFDVSRELADDLTRIVRDEMKNNELRVLVFAVQLAWKKASTGTFARPSPGRPAQPMIGEGEDAYIEVTT